MNDIYAVTEKDMSFLKVLKVVFRSVWKEFPFKFFQFLLVAGLAGLLMTVAPKILQQVIDLIIKGTDIKSFSILFAVYGFCLFGGAILKFLASKISFYLATQIEDKWRYAALRHYYKLYLAWHDLHDSGEIGNKLDKGGSAVFVIIHDLFGNNLLVSLVTLVLVIAYTSWLIPLFSIFLIAPIPIYIGVTYIISKKIVEGQAKLNKLADKANRTLFDGVANVRTVKAFGKEMEEVNLYAKKWSGYHNFEYGVERLWFTQDFLQTAIEVSMRTALLVYCVYAAINGSLTVGQITLLISYQQMTFAPLVQMNSLFTRIRRNAKRITHMFEIMAEEDKLKDAPDAVSINTLRKELKLNKLGFEYSGKIAALHDISITVPVGTTTALVGRSGAGKSTLALLLMRFYDPENGSITFDGVDLRKIKRNSLRKQMAWIPQDTSLFNRTIRENIAYGKENTSQKEIEDAAKLANAHEFILKTTKGYNSIIGERGVRLSGGQRQRIAIARALLTKPSVLIMDESTSHLDSETERAISEAIRVLHNKTTQIIIAHRLSTILHADQIVVLEKGKIVAVGKHKELLKNPIYNKLYRIQFHKKE